MTLIIMIFLITIAVIVIALFGITKNAKAETFSLYCSLIPIFWVTLEIAKENLTFLGERESFGYSIFTDTFFSQKSQNKILLDLDCASEIAQFDGLTIIFVLLTVIISPIALASSQQRTEMISAILIVEALLIGAFVTKDFLIFYVLFESVLIPMFFLIGIKGSGSAYQKVGAAYRFFLYTLAGSIGMLVGIIILYLEKGTLNWYNLLHSFASYSTNPNMQECILVLLITIGFAVKVPMIPFHLWLPEAHTIAPTPGSMVLAALLLKLGGYGILRWLFPIFHNTVYYISPIMISLALISTIYACLTCLRQIDIKRIIAYSSIVHMNICIYSLFTFSPLAIKGAVFEMFSHGVISAGLFFLIGVLYNRHDTRILKYFRGLSMSMPLFSVIFFLFILANSAVPLTCGFIGEFLMLCGAITQIPLLTIILTITSILNAGYNIWLFNRVAFGAITKYFTKMIDLTRKETYILFPLIFYVFFLGIKPDFLFVFIEALSF